jgi:hypothetical protein
MIVAYNIALIPSKAIVEKCYEINETITDRVNIDFRKFGQLPHITLLMGGVNSENLQSIQNDLAAISKQLKPITLTLEGIEENKTASGIKIAYNQELKDLHVIILNKFANRFANKVNTENIIGLPNVTNGTARFINNYRHKSALDKFDPHITIGDGLPKIDTNLFPLTFSTADLRLGAIGNYCTFVDKIY